jgi:hypothetical protein
MTLPLRSTGATLTLLLSGAVLALVRIPMIAPTR